MYNNKENFNSDWIFQNFFGNKATKIDFTKNGTYFVKALQAEKDWQKLLLTDKGGSTKLYEQFISSLGDKGNLRELRIFFRVRQNDNNRLVYKNIRNNNPETLKKARISATFCDWAHKNYKGRHLTKLKAVFEVYKENRNKYIMNNSPMILRLCADAKRKVPKHLVPEIGANMYVAAIEAFDKYSPKYDKKGNAIYSDNLLSCISARIWATVGVMMSTRPVYLGFRGRKLLFKIPRMAKEGKEPVQIAKALKITEEEVNSVSRAGDTVQSDQMIIRSETESPEDLAIDNQKINAIKEVLNTLSLIERKYLVLKKLASYESLG